MAPSGCENPERVFLDTRSRVQSIPLARHDRLRGTRSDRVGSIPTPAPTTIRRQRFVHQRQHPRRVPHHGAARFESDDLYAPGAVELEITAVDTPVRWHWQTEIDTPTTVHGMIQK